MKIVSKSVKVPGHVGSSKLAQSLVYAILCAFSANCYANERYITERMEAMRERTVEIELERAMRISRSMQERQVQSQTERQVQSAVFRSVENNLEQRVNRQIERQLLEHNYQQRTPLSYLRTTEQYEVISRIRTNVESERGVEIDEPDPDINEDDIVFDDFDPTDNDDLDEKSDSLVEDVIEDTLTESGAEQAARAIDFNNGLFEQALNAIQYDNDTLHNIDERNVWTHEWVIMADQDARQLLQEEGYQFSQEEHLEAFDSIVAKVKAPASYDLFSDYQLVMDKLNRHDAVLDLNHVYTNIYTNASDQHSKKSFGLVPGDILSLSGDNIKIGMVDTAIALDHELLQQASITQKHFTQDELDPVYEHGTAVASLLTGKQPDYAGIIPGAELFNASVFVQSSGQQSVATAMSLMRGLNWLVQQDIKVINMSLAGPPNRLLQKAIQKLCNQGVVIVAAAGNDGPLAEPMYPAGYQCAVAVTAVDAENRLYKNAVRGNHIDVAAYGVDIMAADGSSGLSAQSGTSIAAPFVSAWIAAQLPKSGLNNNWVDLALEQCIDLGEEGIDPLFGNGLLPTKATQVARVGQFNPLELVLQR